MVDQWGRFAKALLLLWGVTFLGGCAIEAKHFSSSRLEYNEALQVTEQKELLLNIVRLRYNEPPAFLRLNGISSQLEINSNILIAAETDGDGRLQLLQPEAGIGFSSRPTLTFSPQQDKDFMQQMMAPVGPETLYRLIEYGWGMDRVFSLMVRQINGVGQSIGLEWEGEVNAGLALSLIHQLGQWQRGQQISLLLVQRQYPLKPTVILEKPDVNDVISLEASGYGVLEKETGYILTRRKNSLELEVSEHLASTEEWRRFASTLGLRPTQRRYMISPEIQAVEADEDDILLALRSPLGLMAYLSAGVQVPEFHLSQGAAAQQSAQLPKFFAVHSSISKPDDVYLSVEHRGTWFYIRDADLESRRTLGLLSSLIRQEVQAGGAENLPVLTLPVGR